MRYPSMSVLVLALCASGCRQVEPRAASAPPTVQGRPTRNWTEAFMKEAVLTADVIAIEGPSDLLDHVAIRQDPEAIQYETRTVPEGLLQELVVRPEFGVEIQVQIDAWTMAAFRRVTILQRPGEVPVTIRAQGSAVWSPVAGGGERRNDVLEFHGVHGK